MTAAGDTIGGGRAIDALSADRAADEVATLDLISRFEAARVPVVAAIDGSASASWLAVALGCDYRIAAPTARLAFPHIHLGLLPGGGVTQRLPRLAGMAPALALLLSGKPLSAMQAFALGLIDRIATGELLADAIAFAEVIAPNPRRRLREVTVAPDDAAIAAARAKAAHVVRGGLAEHGAIDAVAMSAVTPLDAGVAIEARICRDLIDSEQSAARIHLFVAEQAAAKLPDGSAPSAFEIRTCAVIGAGTMGIGIATTCADAGVAVALIDTQFESLERAKNVIAANYAATVSKRRLAPAEADARIARITYSTEYAAAGDVDLVIEAVFEQLDVKQAVFRQLDASARPDTILATNTSTLDIAKIAAATQRPDGVVGLHFFSPANVMRLLEIVPGERTSLVTLGRALAIGKQLGKIPVVAGNTDGFIGNRMLYSYRREAEFLLEEGASPQRIDSVLTAFGLAMGPFAMADLAGLDIGWRVRKRRYAEHPPIGRYSTIADTLCEAGRFGQKTGAGYYKYAGGDRTPIPDPVVDDVIARAATAAKIKRRDISDDEIVKRCLYPLINEGARIVQEGIAARPSDIDVVYCNGYGFPRWRGGPMRWADSIGLGAVYDDIVRFREEFGDIWQPAELLRELAQHGGSFGSWERT